MPGRRTVRTAVVTTAVAASMTATAVLSAAPASAARAPATIVYDATGSTTLTNPNSKVTVNFAPTLMTVTLVHGGKSIAADLPLAPVNSRFKAYGFLPVRGTVVFTQVQPVTGTLDLSQEPFRVTATASYVVSLRNVTIGGADAHVGTNCQTIKPVKVSVVDGGDFDLTTGTLLGTYDLGKFQDCAGAQNIINDTLPGTGNSLKLHINLHNEASAAKARAAMRAATSS